MKEYQVLARKYRPQTFREVLGQEAIVATLINAIKFNRLAHAYLFCGSRGTGKTTLARIFAKALNCERPNEGFDPCNMCSSCKEITAGTSLDVLEIDGASHRGIEDIRQINETVGYAAASGKYKIYLIDEVHMLTKEAFNALLKTLEEPPAKVKFFFATTEPHKVLPTILSRCQRFNLNRIPLDKIVQKLDFISKEVGCEIESDAIQLIASRAEGGLRDAESLFDQILSFSEGKITTETVASILGLMPRDIYFEIDQAGKEGHLAKAFEIAHLVFSGGKDLLHFIEGLVLHFRNILLVRLLGPEAPFLALSNSERKRYIQSAAMYTQEQCTTILDMLLHAQDQIRFAPSGKIALEALLLKVMRVHYRISVDVLIERLIELEKAVSNKEPASPAEVNSEPLQQLTPDPAKSANAQMNNTLPQAPLKELSKVSPILPDLDSAKPLVEPGVKKELTASAQTPKKPSLADSISEDPTPTAADLGVKKAAAKEPAKSKEVKPQAEVKPIPKTKQGQYDTLLQFAAVELEGKIQRNR